MVSVGVMLVAAPPAQTSRDRVPTTRAVAGSSTFAGARENRTDTGPAAAGPWLCTVALSPIDFPMAPSPGPFTPVTTRSGLGTKVPDPETAVDALPPLDVRLMLPVKLPSVVGANRTTTLPLAPAERLKDAPDAILNGPKADA